MAPIAGDLHRPLPQATASTTEVVMDGFTRFRALKTAPEQWEEPDAPLTEEERQALEEWRAERCQKEVEFMGNTK